jgi:hypothetical protein
VYSNGYKYSTSCCKTNKCNTILESETAKTIQLALIIGISVGGFCFLVCVIICVSLLIYCCCCKDRSQRMNNPPSVYIVGSNQTGHFQQQSHMQYTKKTQENINDGLRESSQSLPPPFDQVNQTNSQQAQFQYSNQNQIRTDIVNNAHTSNQIEQNEMKNYPSQSVSAEANINNINSNFNEVPMKGFEEPDEDPYFDKYYGGHKSKASDSDSSDQNIENDSDQLNGFKKGLRRIPYL